jgi:hypothetical protein
MLGRTNRIESTFWLVRLAISVAREMSVAAVSTVGKIMVDANAPAASRVRAASCILECAAQAIEIEEIEARLDAL